MPWDIVGLAETWLDPESEKGLAVGGFGVLCASRSGRSGGGVALLIRDGLTERDLTWVPLMRGFLSRFL